MWDEEAGPLWGDEGLLEDEPGWMRRVLGLSDELIGDLDTWMSDMSALQFGPYGVDWRERLEELDRRGENLAQRLGREVGARYSVSYHR